MRRSQIVVVALLLALVTLATTSGAWLASRIKASIPDASEAMGFSLPSLPDWAHDPLPDFSQYSDASERKAAFFQFLLPRVQLANERFLLVREALQRLAQEDEPSTKDKALLGRVAEVLKIRTEPGSEAFFATALRRVDAIPPSLVLAQAANESAWGTSRFAREGNNLFGQWCFTPGCGLVPSQRRAGATHEVARFESPYASVAAYMINLNRHPTYRSLRNRRESLRASNEAVTGLRLAPGLVGYSERGEAYVEEIQALIHANNLQKFDHPPRS